MTLGLAPLTIAYSFFASIAAGTNLTVQWLVLRLRPAVALLGSHLIFAALVAGTGSGLVVKYLLDKRFIFRDASTGARAHARRFSLYTAMSLITTVIFWLAELASNAIAPGTPFVLVGGAIGLVVGYTVKYQLDHRFTFS